MNTEKDKARLLARGNKRLLLHAEFLENDPIVQQHFDMGSWCEHDGEASSAEVYKDLAEGSCGTTACVAGWVPVRFPRLFKTTKKLESEEVMFRETEASPWSRRTHVARAADKLFTLNDYESDFLFTRYSVKAPSAHEMAGVIRAFVEKRKEKSRHLSADELNRLNIYVREHIFETAY